MSNNSEKAYKTPFEFCDKCGCKLEFEKLNRKRINHGRSDIYTTVSKCPKCGKKVTQDRVKVL